MDNNDHFSDRESQIQSAFLTYEEVIKDSGAMHVGVNNGILYFLLERDTSFGFDF